MIKSLLEHPPREAGLAADSITTCKFTQSGEASSQLIKEFSNSDELFFLDEMSKYKHYNCPVYKTSERWGILATTGHSTNFVCNVSLTSKDASSKWTVSGLAGFLALKTC